MSRAEEMLHNHCEIVQDFGTELSKYADLNYYSRHVKRMQLPFTPVSSKSAPTDPEAVKLRRQELAKRLVEMNARKREQKVF